MYLLANRAQNVDPDKEAQVVQYMRRGLKRTDSFSTYARKQGLKQSSSRAFRAWTYVSYRCNLIARSSLFTNFITAVIILASALVGVQTYPSMEYIPGRETNSAASKVWNVMDQVVLAIFTLEVVLKVLAEGNAPWHYFFKFATASNEDELGAEPDSLPSMWNASQTFASAVSTKARKKKRRKKQPAAAHEKPGFANMKLDFWNIFDFAVVVVCYLPLGANMVAVIRLFRLLRVLKLVRALPELQVLVVGLLSSLTSIFYVSTLLFLVFYLYAILSVTMLRENDPVHWPNLETAFMTLFRMATLEDWTDVMYTAMLGCDVYKLPFRRELCTSPKPMGWIAAPMFVSFVIVATFVVLNLFIGVINENMGLAKEQLKEMKKADLHGKIPEEEAAELRELFALSKRVKKVHKRIARLHQGMEMAQYDMKTFIQAVDRTSQRFTVNSDYTVSATPHSPRWSGFCGLRALLRQRSAKVAPGAEP
eukprot:jgi/Tetstr1/432590/TSEL_021960.t1